jgi:hypothetical protein
MVLIYCCPLPVCILFVPGKRSSSLSVFDYFFCDQTAHYLPVHHLLSLACAVSHTADDNIIAKERWLRKVLYPWLLYAQNIYLAPARRSDRF